MNKKKVIIGASILGLVLVLTTGYYILNSIKVTSANELNSDRSIKRDVFKYIEYIDGKICNINSGNYIRITFERNLTNHNDILIYAKGKNSQIEVYEKNKNISIAKFINITNEGYYDILLTNLTDEQDTFDLKVLNSPITFDYITDPTINISQSDTFSSGNMYTNITTEANFTHLTINSNIDTDGINWSSLVAYYPFDVQENASVNKTYDYSKSNNDGTLTNGVAYNTTGCIYGNCYTFDGVDDYVNAINFADNLTNMTISAWIKTANGVSTRQIVAGKITNYASGAGWLFSVSSGKIGLLLQQDGSNYLEKGSNTLVNDSLWHHVTAIKNGSNINVSVDSVISGVNLQNGGTVNTFSNAVPVRIGNDNNNEYFFNGSIDEVMIFNTSLNSSQISAIYNNQSQRFKTQGQQTVKQVNITSGYNQINLTTQFNNYFGSNISARLGAWDVSLGYNNSDLNSSANGLVSYYHFDEASWNGTSGEVKDAMGLNNGTAQNATGRANTTASGVYGRAGQFNGVNNFVNATNSSAVISHSLWQMNSTTSSWTFVAYNGSTFFTNGVSGLTVQYPLNISGNKIKIGFNYTGNQLFNGTIDEVMIFNRSLSASEVKELYVKGRANWNYTAWQNLSSNGNTFNISGTTTNLLPDFNFLAGTNNYPMFSPNLIGNIILNTLNSNCWSKNNNILFIPIGCQYQINSGISNTP